MNHQLIEGLEHRRMFSVSTTTMDQFVADNDSQQALLLPAVQAAREAARTTQSTVEQDRLFKHDYWFSIP